MAVAAISLNPARGTAVIQFRPGIRMALAILVAAFARQVFEIQLGGGHYVDEPSELGALN